LIRSISIQKVCEEWIGGAGEGLGVFERDVAEEEEEEEQEDFALCESILETS
jgi:hypothetical protein